MWRIFTACTLNSNFNQVSSLFSYPVHSLLPSLSTSIFHLLFFKESEEVEKNIPGVQKKMYTSGQEAVLSE